MIKTRIGIAFFYVGIFSALLCLLWPNQVYAQDMSPEGYWKTVPDDDANPALIHVWKDNDKIFAKIIKLFVKEGDDPNPKCTKCQGDLKDAPIIGLTIIRNLSKDGDEWSGGQILDPNNGKYYKCYIQVVENGTKLKVRGYIGFALLGRTQHWLRQKAP
jgi:uncharacterized protein (DUF2147 family)